MKLLPKCLNRPAVRDDEGAARAAPAATAPDTSTERSGDASQQRSASGDSERWTSDSTTAQSPRCQSRLTRLLVGRAIPAVDVDHDPQSPSAVAGVHRVRNHIRCCVPAVMENVPLAQRLKGLIPGVEELAARCQEPQAKHEGLWCNNSSGVMTIARREEANVPGGLYHVWRNSARVVKTTVGSWASTASDGRKAAYLFVDVLKRDLSMLRHPALAAVGSSTAPGGDVDASSSSKSSGSVAGSFDLVSPTGVLDEAASLEILDAMRDCEVFVELLGDSGWRGVERVSLQCVPSSLLLTPCLVETDIFVVQVVGRMRATLVPPAHVLDLYLYPLRHPYHGSSMVDWRHPDFFQWPRSQHVRGMSTVLEPGRTLFVPRSWYVCYETFAADSPSVAVHIRPRGAAARHTGAMQDQPELGAPVKDSRVAELLHRVERWATAQVGVSKAAEILPQLASEYSRPQRSSPPLTPSASDSASNLSADHHEQLFDCLTWALDEAGWDRTLPDIAVDIATKQLASGNWTGSPYRGGGSDARRER